MIALSERSEDFPGVTMVKSYRRVYPYAPLAAHVVGYMGAITEEDVAHYKQLGYDTSNRGEEVGRAGVELEYETTLHGEWGEIVYEVDSHGSVVREISRKEAVNGMDVQLVHRPRRAAVRRAPAADAAAPQAGVHGAQPGRQEARRHAASRCRSTTDRVCTTRRQPGR